MSEKLRQMIEAELKAGRPNAFGDYFRKLRSERRLTLRRFCRDGGFDPGNISRMERGIYPPPASERLHKLATALGLESGTPEWEELFDRAARVRWELLTGEAPKPATGWIPTAERLPTEEGVECLVVAGGEVQYMAATWDGERFVWADAYEYGKSVVGGELPSELVTHWQPLPQPPEAEK